MISLKTVFNYIKFANELTNKVSFMFNGIQKICGKNSMRNYVITRTI